MSKNHKLKRTQVISHRGLEPSKKNFFAESSYEAFKDHLDRGFGIEFDPNFIQDNRIVIAHDATLNRITNGQDTRAFRNVSPDEVPTISLGKGRLCFFEELMDLIRKSKSTVNAMHLKGGFQNDTDVEVLIDHIKKSASDLIHRFLIFDLKPEIARKMLDKIPNLHLAPSVAHPYDIERYNGAVKGTLISIEDALKYKEEGLYDWVWLDEWDLADKKNGQKKFYTKETFDTLHNAGYKISLVTPELHGTSPGLLGGEAHPDSKPKEKLFTRIKEIISLGPDSFCTDYPEEVVTL